MGRRGQGGRGVGVSKKSTQRVTGKGKGREGKRGEGGSGKGKGKEGGGWEEQPPAQTNRIKRR